MPRWTPAPIVGGAYTDDARSFSVQDTVNWIPERSEAEGTRSDGILRDAPGAHVRCDLGTNAPVRGLHNVEGRLLAVSGSQLFEVAADFTATSRGTIPGVSRVSIAHNQITGGNEVLIANGQSGYVYNTVTETLAQVTDDAYPGATVVDYLAQVMPQIEPQRRFWFHSDVTQATQYLSTDEYEAESAPDLLVTLIASHGQLLVLGDRTGEFYAATGGNTSFFERMEGTTMEVGCAAAHAVVRLDSTVFWLGSDGIGYRLNGYTAQRITTHAIEQAWSRCDLKKAFAFTFEDLGHKIVYFTFPDGGTWGYDVATQTWHRRTSHGMNRWRMNALVFWNGKWIAGDYSNGKLYELDWDHKLECCEPLERRRISGVLHDNQNDVGVNAAEFVFETGGVVSVAGEAVPSISGSLPDVAFGDTVDYQYTITPAYAGQRVTLTLDGELPTGLTLSATGQVTGTITGAGTFNWTITPSGECVSGAPLDDSATFIGPEIFAWRYEDTGSTHPCTSAFVDGDVIGVSQQNTTVAYSTDRGQTFTVVTAYASFMDVFGIVKYEGDWYIFGQGGGASKAAKAVGDSFSFSPITAPATYPNNGRAAFVQNDFIYIAPACAPGNLLLYKFDGTSYTTINTGIAVAAVNEQIDSMAAISDGWLLGTTEGRVIKTTDLETTFTIELTAASRVNGVTSLHGQTLAATTSTIYQSADNGDTWDAGSATGTTNGLSFLMNNAVHFISGSSYNVLTSPTGLPGSWTARLDASILGGGQVINAPGYSSTTLAVYPCQGGYVYIGDIA